MKAPSFRLKVLVALAALVATAQLASTLAVLYATDRNAIEHAGTNLQVGGRVLRDHLATRTRHLEASAGALVADFAFRHAAVSDDAPTVLQLILERTRVRAGAGILMLVSPEGRLRASTSILADRDRPFPFPRLLEAAKRDGSAADVVPLQGHLVRLVLVPVLAPERIAWVGMGFPVDDALAAELASLTGVEVAFRVVDADGAGRVLASTLPSAERERLAASLARSPLPERARATRVDGTDYLAVEQLLTVHAGATVSAVLLSSTTRAFQDFAGLRVQLVLVSGAALLLATILAVAVSRSVTRPVQRLVAAAERVAAGDYAAAVHTCARDEFGLLARTFNQMLDGIARREARMVQQARHDPLTGLPNRLQAADRLEQLCGAAAGSGALVLLDLLQFCRINEAFGLRTGDEVLIRVGERLRAASRGEEQVFRIGGEEFLVLLGDADPDAVLAATRRLVAAASEPVPVAGTTVDLEVSAGVALYPEHGADAENLLRHVEEALQAAPQTTARIAVYDPATGEQRQRRLAIVRDLGQAIDDDALELHYQPKLDLATGEVRSCEALLRWTHPELGFMPPDEFIGIAEQSGGIRRLTGWVLQTALAQMRDWRSRGLDLGVAVNLSALDLLDETLPDMLAAALAANDIPPSRLTLEITESALMRDHARCVGVLGRLRVAGMRVAIDDFGVGYSSLGQLRRLPVDELKIDRSFVQHMLESDEDEMIVRATNDLAHHMGLSTVAEGAETAAVLARLRHIGCDVVQGYLLSRPLPVEAVEAWLAAQSWRRLLRRGVVSRSLG